MQLEFGLISQEELADFLENCNSRYIYVQSDKYINVCKAMDRDFDILALKNEQEILAAGIVFKYRFKKFFKKAELVFGPVVRDNNTDYFIDFMKQLVGFYRKKLRVIALEVVPLILDRYFDDVEVIGENSEANLIKKELAEIGFKHIDRDFTDAPYNTQVKYIYVKDIEAKDLKEVEKSFVAELRRRMKKAKELDVKVRFLKPDELDIMEKIFAETSDRVHYQVNLETTKYIAENYDEAYFPVAYIDVLESLKSLNENLENTDAEIEKINKNNEEFGENKKRINRLKNANDLKNNIIKKIADVKALGEKYGNIIYMSSGSFYVTPSDMVYLQGGMRREFEDYYPNHALLEHMMKLAIEKKCQYFNFFGISAASLVDENASDYGVLQFKRNFVGEVQEFIGTYEYNYLPFL